MDGRESKPNYQILKGEGITQRNNKTTMTSHTELPLLEIKPSTDENKLLFGEFTLKELLSGFKTTDGKEALDVLAQAIQEAVSECTENLARYFYNQMRYDGTGDKPAWVERGNSIKQDEARAMARKALSQPEGEKGSK